MDAHLLSIITFLPALAAVILAVFLKGDDAPAQRNARWLAMFTSLATLLASLFVYFEFDPADTGMQFVVESAWPLGLTYRMGVDGISVLLVLLTTALMPVIVGASWGIGQRVKEFMIALLSLQTLILGAFMSLDLVFFFLFMEASILPLAIMVSLWGGGAPLRTALRLFTVSLFGTVPTLIGILLIFAETGSTCLSGCLGGELELLSHTLPSAPLDVAGFTIPGGMQTLLLLAFGLSFALKLPLWPLHRASLSAQTQAPAALAMVMAALVTKLGAYGLFRIALPLFPAGVEVLADALLWLTVLGIVASALAACAQDDMKAVIGYACVAQMGFVVLGILSGTQQGVEGALLLMLSHAVVAAALFLCAGALHRRMQTSAISAYGGVRKRMPAFAGVFLLFLLAGIGLPGTAGFAGHVLIFMGVLEANSLVALVALIALALSVAYALSLYRRVVMGDLIKESLKSISDLSARELWLCVPLIIVVVVLGVAPGLVLDMISATVAALTDGFAAATGAQAAAE
ncbi:MAG: NADH-quinone oxidoreductase subunit M [Pseudomonadota bacterium]